MNPMEVGTAERGVSKSYLMATMSMLFSWFECFFEKDFLETCNSKFDAFFRVGYWLMSNGYSVLCEIRNTTEILVRSSSPESETFGCSLHLDSKMLVSISYLVWGQRFKEIHYQKVPEPQSN
ncbi:hypothetical protein QQP08_018313 [Theobroma cacao]|nr:hypothetical protein QQP08_018313 [Theobroma cacao]